MAPGTDETTEFDKGFKRLCGTDAELRHAAAVGKSGATIMAALLLEGGVNYLTNAIAAKCREAALIAHGVEDDAPGSE